MIMLILALILVAYFGIGYVVWRVTRGRGGITRLAILIVVMLGVPYVIWSVIYPSSTVHARITLEVETPEGAKVGSSVQKITYRLEPCPLCNSSGPVLRRIVQGEAVAVDLAQRGVLFALLNGGAGGYPSADPVTPVIIEKLFGMKEDANWRGAAAVRVLGRASGRSEIPLELLPFLARFRDINDPKSVERIDPGDLAATFGSDVKLVRATIEIVPSGWWPLNVFGITSTPLTTGIEKRLVWLPALRAHGGTLDGSRISRSNELSNSLGGGAFKT